MVLIYKSAHVTTRFLLFFTFTTLGRNKVTPSHMWGRIYIEGPSRHLWKGVSEQQKQHPGSWLAPHTGVLPGLELLSQSGCSCPLVPSVSFYFFDSYLTKLHTSIPADWGPLLLLSIHCKLSQTSTLRQLPRHLCMGFPWEGSGAHPKPSPREQWPFPPTVLSEHSAPATVTATSSSWHGGAKKVLSYPRTPTCHHLNVSQWHFLLFPQISRVWIWDMGCKHNSQSKLRLHW